MQRCVGGSHKGRHILRTLPSGRLGGIHLQRNHQSVGAGDADQRRIVHYHRADRLGGLCAALHCARLETMGQQGLIDPHTERPPSSRPIVRQAWPSMFIGSEEELGGNLGLPQFYGQASRRHKHQFSTL